MPLFQTVSVIKMFELAVALGGGLEMVTVVCANALETISKQATTKNENLIIEIFLRR